MKRGHSPDNLCTYWRPFSWVQGAARRHEDSVEGLCGRTFWGGGPWAPRFFACVVRHTPTQRNPLVHPGRIDFPPEGRAFPVYHRQGLPVFTWAISIRSAVGRCTSI